MTTKNCANGPKLVLKDLCEKSFVQNVRLPNYDVDVDSLFHKLSWKDLKSQCQILNTLMVFKTFYRLVPKYLLSKFIK